MNTKAAGAVSGALATIPMTLFMEAAHKILPDHEQYPLPPREITMRAADAAGIAEHADAPGRRTPATLTAHFGMGAAAGMAYAALAGRTEMPPALEGAVYGLAVWGASYLGVLPGLGISQNAHNEPASRNALMMGAHLVYGAALGAIFGRLSEQR